MKFVDRTTSPKLGVIGGFGDGNLGDDAVFVAFQQWMRANAPHVIPIALCANPRGVHERYGLSASHVSGESAGRSRDHGVAAPAHTRTEVPHASPRPSIASRIKRRWPRLAARARAGLNAVHDGLSHVRYWPTQLRIARSLDALVVAGAGQIHDYWTGPLGQPATLFGWALACRIVRTPFAVISVGVVPLQHGLSRAFVRWVLDWSSFASARDIPSAALMRSLGATREYPVVPDLAWGLSVVNVVHHAAREPLENRDDPPKRPRRVGICPMVYNHPRYWPRGNAAAYQHYIEALATFSARLIRSGFEVDLFPTQIRSDPIAIADVVQCLEPDVRPYVAVRRVEGIIGLLEAISCVDVVVTTRFHGVLLALLCRRPALSLSYQSKSDELLEAIGQRRFALDVHAFTEEQLANKFAELCNAHGAFAAALPAHTERERARLDGQYRELFERLGWLRVAHAGATGMAPATKRRPAA